jgi:uncharacterized phage-associated protein
MQTKDAAHTDETRRCPTVTVNVNALADYIVTKCTIDRHPIPNLRLQHMLYVIQFVYARQTDGSLLFDETFEAWPTGPTIRDVYLRYSDFGGRPIEHVTNAQSTHADNLMSERLKAFVDAGIEILRERPPRDLSQITQAPGTPWHKARQAARVEIPNDAIIRAATARRETETKTEEERTS